MDETKRPSLRSFDAYADRNGQDLGQDAARDLARPHRLQQELAENPDWQAELARTASSSQRRDSTEGGSIASVEATEAETPPETLARIADPSRRE